jgi:hypothetical protein
MCKNIDGYLNTLKLSIKILQMLGNLFVAVCITGPHDAERAGLWMFTVFRVKGMSSLCFVSQLCFKL